MHLLIKHHPSIGRACGTLWEDMVAEVVFLGGIAYALVLNMISASVIIRIRMRLEGVSDTFHRLCLHMHRSERFLRLL